jgi:chromosome segregation protein
LSALLTGIYLCQDTQELSLRKPLLEAGESLVTRDGLWAGTNWVLQLGEEDQRSGMLAREQEITDIRKQLDEITQNALALKSRTDGDRQSLQHFEQQRDGEQRALNQLQQQASDLRNQLTQRKGRVDQVHTRHHQLEKELFELDELQLKHKAELQANSEKRNALLIQIEQMAEQDADLLIQKEDYQQTLNSSRNRLKQSREQAHQQQMQLQSLEAEHRSSLANIERMRQQSEQFDRRSEELALAIEDVIAPIQVMEESLQALLESRRQNEGALAQSQELATKLDNQQRSSESQRNIIQTQVDDTRNSLEEQRMESQALKIRCNTVEEQLQKTGVDLTELAENLNSEATPEQWQQQLDEIEARIDRLGPINLAAIDEYQEQSERKVYLDAQNEDLTSALTTLENAIKKIDKETRDRFKETFDHVNSRMGARFPKLFGGGEARLELTEDDLLNTGVVIMARPPGKRVTNLQLLSGGEKALTAVALIFAIFELNPSPFCMLDEVDAPLDDANVARFCAMVGEMSEQVQFIMISHNKITMELAQNLNGVTMHEPGVSRLVSVDVSAAVELVGVQ